MTTGKLLLHTTATTGILLTLLVFYCYYWYSTATAGILNHVKHCSGFIPGISQLKERTWASCLPLNTGLGRWLTSYLEDIFQEIIVLTATFPLRTELASFGTPIQACWGPQTDGQKVSQQLWSRDLRKKLSIKWWRWCLRPLSAPSSSYQCSLYQNGPCSPPVLGLLSWPWVSKPLHIWQNLTRCSQVLPSGLSSYPAALCLLSTEVSFPNPYFGGWVSTLPSPILQVALGL